ncbi:hypothetical protein LTS18_003651 [Coniosporium uncinatum]|uniref:Uncharacterized protein n=1 Tax=Coniosporium uncinatum TaxID=93489 RepID=A0ACC3DYS9_9PEZI|nr:hypothetical protein LTS18_003651 [Coniosporium uncinatum]
MKRSLRDKLENAKYGSDKGKEKATESGDAEKQTEPVKDETSMEVDHPASSSNKSDSNPLATIPLALSAARSAALASHEERATTRLVSAATNIQLQKLELKLQQFTELENLLSAERRDLERRRQQLFLDRLAFQKRMRSVEDSFARAMNLSMQGNLQEGMRVVKEVVGGGFGQKYEVKKRGSVAGGADEVRPVAEEALGYKAVEI